MAEIPVDEISVEVIHAVCFSLGKLVEALMEPHSQAMILGSSGELSFSRRGIKVLLESSPGHPLAKLIIQSIKKYHIETGDDCKIFLTLVKEIIDGIKNKLTKTTEVYVRKEMSSHILYFQERLPEVFKKIRNCSHAIYTSSNSELFPKYLEGLVLTTLAFNFPFRIAKKLTELICDFLCASISDWNTATDTLSYMISHFDIFCSKVNSPLENSTVLKGFVLYYKLDLNINSLTNIHFVIIHEISQKVSDTYTVEQSGNMKYFLENYLSTIKKAICSLLDHGVSMILTPSMACENIKSFCLLKGVILIDRLVKDDINLILSVCDISPLNGLLDKWDDNNIGLFRHVSSLKLSKCSYVHLEMAAVRSAFVPHHFVLCTPVENLGKDCYAEVLNCLKIVRKWLSFEISGHEIMGNKSLESSRPTASLPVGISFPMGLWELLFKEYLNSICSYQILFEILDIALLKIICKTWNIKVIDFHGEESYQTFHERIKQNVPNPIEAISIKEDLIDNVLSLIRQLLKIDAIVSRK